MAIDPAALRKVALFESLLPEHLKLIAGIVEEVQYKPSTTIFQDGAVADRFFFIISGKVRISKQIPGIGEEALAILEPGDYFGEMALIDDSPRSADAITNTTVVVGAIAKATFEDLLFMNKDLAYDMLWTFVRTLSARLRETNEKMRAFLVMAGKF
jgi:CRP-like cAMP-binding protein